MILKQLISKSKFLGYKKLRLDTIQFMKAAINLYKSFGFKEISPYEDCELPLVIAEHGVYMESEI